MTKCVDVEALLPSFRPRVRRMELALEERGFRAVVNETYRSRERAAMLSRDPDGDGPRKAPGIKESMHCLCAAVDWRCGEHKWECDKHGCGFYEAVGEVAESLGLVWGGRWGDAPHVQCVRIADQARFRKLTTPEERDAFVFARLADLP